MNIGKRLRELRKKQGLTLNELSKKSGVAVATISRIETDKMTGTVDSHMSIAKALDMTLPELYSELDRPITVQKEKDHADVFVRDDKTSSVILTKDVINKKMLPILIRLKRGGKTRTEELKRGTEKFLYVIEGVVEAVIGKEKSAIEKGSTLYFDASRPHYIKNVGTSEATCLYVATPSAL